MTSRQHDQAGIAAEAGRTIRSAMTSWARTARLVIILVVVPLGWHALTAWTR